MNAFPGFRDVVLVDFEFHAPPGECPSPICMVALNYRDGALVRLWEEDLRQLAGPPFSTGPETLFVAYYASAETGCFLALGWPMPERIVDLYAEFRCLTNGRSTPCGSGLLGALAYFGEAGRAPAEKESMRDLAIRGGPWTPGEQQALLEYCESDVRALAVLLPHLEKLIDLPRALWRGRYMAVLAQIERNGVPLDVSTLGRLREGWSSIRHQLIKEIDASFGVYEGTVFKRDRWERWLLAQTIPWPRLCSGGLALDDETFRQMGRAYPAIAPMRELRASLSEFRAASIAVGRDGRNRCLLSAFRSTTGRNQPSSTQYVFGPSVWLRSLIQPPPGYGLAYIDWSQQEFGIAASLSGDAAMQEAYLSGDPYLEFARQAGAVPKEATKQTHGDVREQFKQCVLGVQYGMGEETLALRIGQPKARARELLRLHRETYPKFWRWSDGALDHAMLHGRLHTVFGWTVHIADGGANPRSLRNFPMQANGAEMLRLACIRAIQDVPRICATVHDALLIEAPLARLAEAVLAVQEGMRWASRQVLDGFELRSDAKVIGYPGRYTDPRGERMWTTVMRLLDDSVASSALCAHG